MTRASGHSLRQRLIIILGGILYVVGTPFIFAGLLLIFAGLLLTNEDRMFFGGELVAFFGGGLVAVYIGLKLRHFFRSPGKRFLHTPLDDIVELIARTLATTDIRYKALLIYLLLTIAATLYVPCHPARGEHAFYSQTAYMWMWSAVSKSCQVNFVLVAVELLALTAGLGLALLLIRIFQSRG